MPKYPQIVTTISTVRVAEANVTTIDELTAKLKKKALRLAAESPVEYIETGGEPRWRIRAAYRARGANRDDVARMIASAAGVPFKSVHTIHLATYRLPAEVSAA